MYRRARQMFCSIEIALQDASFYTERYAKMCYNLPKGIETCQEITIVTLYLLFFEPLLMEYFHLPLPYILKLPNV